MIHISRRRDHTSFLSHHGVILKIDGAMFKVFVPAFIITTSSMLNESAEHVTITADGDYDSVVTPDEDGFVDSVTNQLYTTSGVSENRITNVETSSGQKTLCSVINDQGFSICNPLSH